MAKVQSENDNCYGAASKALKSNKATKEQVQALIDKANAKNRFLKASNESMKPMIYKNVGGIRTPFILKNGSYIAMTPKAK